MLLALRNFIPGYLLLNKNISRCRPYFLCRGPPDSCCFVRTPCRNSFCTVYLTAQTIRGGWIWSTTLKIFHKYTFSFFFVFFFTYEVKRWHSRISSMQSDQIQQSIALTLIIPHELWRVWIDSFCLVKNFRRIQQNCVLPSSKYSKK